MGRARARAPERAPADSLTVSKDNMSKLKEDLQSAIHQIEDLNKLKKPD